MSIRSVLGNWIARHNQLLWFRSNGQRLERSQVAHSIAFCAIEWGKLLPALSATGRCGIHAKLTQQLQPADAVIKQELPDFGKGHLQFFSRMAQMEQQHQ
jgi:hypothetical protein